MYQVGDIPPVSAGSGRAVVFMGTPCNSTKWIEDAPDAPTMWL